jgi:hypothetical protein
MPIQVQDRREDGRNRIPGFVDAEIVFNGPDGASHKYPLVALSVAGASFVLPQRVPGLDAETTWDGGLVRVGEIEIRVNLQVRHVTRGDGKEYECGVRLYPMSDQDRNEMAALISRLRSVPA